MRSTTEPDWDHTKPFEAKYLCFAGTDTFQALLFGLSTAYRVFKIVRLIETFLKVPGVDMHQYLDDWQLNNQLKLTDECHCEVTLFLIKCWCSESTSSDSGSDSGKVVSDQAGEGIGWLDTSPQTPSLIRWMASYSEVETPGGGVT